MVGIQVGNEQEERKGEEKRMIRENIGNSLSRAMRETTSAAATLTTRRSKCSCSSAERREREESCHEGAVGTCTGISHLLCGNNELKDANNDRNDASWRE